MSKVIQRIKDPEIFFGIVAAIGTNIENCIGILEKKLESYAYKVAITRVTDSFDKIAPKALIPVELKKTPLEARYETHIAFGDALRTKFDDDSFLAGIAIDQVIEKRKAVFTTGSDVPQKFAYIMRQFKRREEIDLLRSVYGRLFFQISIYSKRSNRVDNLASSIADSHNSPDNNSFRKHAENLVEIDENEASDEHGQRISDVFHDADYIINADVNEKAIEDQIDRFIKLIFGANNISPTRDEYGLYIAKSASLRSLDLSRQVGAAIFTKQGEVISLGSNEVPKGGGGTYWCDDPNDDRDYVRKEDSNQKRKKEIFRELNEIISKQLPDNFKMEFDFSKSQFMDALEYGRIIHAEMSAIVDAARRGLLTADATLYCTTFPCHMCAKHIVAAGLKQVVFLEPYPKSLASELHADSISIDGHTRGDYYEFPHTIFRHFFGVPPRRYRDLFERQKRKAKDGKFQPWKNGCRQLIVEVKVPIYLLLEADIIQNILNPHLEKIDMSIAELH
jgi:deoxycytidylate deaminase